MRSALAHLPGVSSAHDDLFLYHLIFARVGAFLENSSFLWSDARHGSRQVG